MSKAGNKFLKYYLIEAANSVSNNIPEYRDFYLKKYIEVKTYQHKIALALTFRKLIRLNFELLVNNQLYSSKRVTQTEAFPFSSFFFFICKWSFCCTINYAILF